MLHIAVYFLPDCSMHMKVPTSGRIRFASLRHTDSNETLEGILFCHRLFRPQAKHPSCHTRGRLVDDASRTVPPLPPEVVSLGETMRGSA